MCAVWRTMTAACGNVDTDGLRVPNINNLFSELQFLFKILFF